MSSTPENVLLAHIVSQTMANVDFLVAQNYLSQADASVIKAKLPAADLASRIGGMQLNNRYPTPPMPSPPIQAPVVQAVYSPPPVAPPRAVPPPPVPVAMTEKARAIWAYNEDGRDADDLSFSAGETIEIVEKTNNEWWTGRTRGKTALFPSNYVELVQDHAPAYSPPVEKQPYRPFGASYHGMAAPSPAPQQVHSGTTGLQENTEEQEKKKSKYGKYGNTLAHSAVGGVGFGAGSAIGGGIIRSIF